MKMIEMEWLQWFGSGRNHTLILVSLAFIIAHADEALLPGVYREISAVLHVSPVGLGTLSMIRTITQASCSPLAAYAAVHHNRVSVISLGALLWTLATYASGFSSSYAQVYRSKSSLPSSLLHLLNFCLHRFSVDKCLKTVHLLHKFHFQYS